MFLHDMRKNPHIPHKAITYDDGLVRLNQWSRAFFRLLVFNQQRSKRPARKSVGPLMRRLTFNFRVKLLEMNSIPSNEQSASRTCVFPLRMPKGARIDVWARGDRGREAIMIIYIIDRHNCLHIIIIIITIRLTWHLTSYTNLLSHNCIDSIPWDSNKH